jgi:hypothetical protein
LCAPSSQTNDPAPVPHEQECRHNREHHVNERGDSAGAVLPSPCIDCNTAGLHTPRFRYTWRPPSGGRVVRLKPDTTCVEAGGIRPGARVFAPVGPPRRGQASLAYRRTYASFSAGQGRRVSGAGSCAAGMLQSVPQQ